MLTFSETSADIAALVHTLAEIIGYPLIDSKMSHDINMEIYYQKATDVRNSFASDLARNEAFKLLKSVARYLEDPSYCNYFSLMEKIHSYNGKYNLNKIEVTEDE